MKKVRYALSFVLIGILLINPCFAKEPDIRVFINGTPINLSCNPIIKSGNTLVPFRSIFESLGLTVSYDANTKTVSGKNNDIEITLIIGKNNARVNGEEKALPTPAVIVNSSTMVPVRFIAESTGYTVTWDQKNRSVLIGDTAVEGDILLESTELMANVYDLYSTDATGSYSGYKQLHGYPNEDEFSIYYKGTSSSNETTYEDNRGLNLNAVYRWSYNGVTYRNTRRELYGFFFDTARFSSNYAIDGGVLSSSWFESTFGQVYSDWMDTVGYSCDASHLVSKYLENLEGIHFRQQDLTPDAVISYMQEWTSVDNLHSFDVVFDEGITYDGEIITAAGFYSGSYSGPLIYGMPSFDRTILQNKTNFTKTIDGIAVKYEDGILSFKTDDLVKQGIIEEK